MSKIFQNLTAISTLILILTIFMSHDAAAVGIPNIPFPRTANYYLKAGIGIPPSDYAALAKYDLLIFPAEAQVWNRNMFGELRRLNPKVIILAYVPTKSYIDAWADPLHDNLKARLQNAWWLNDASGRSVSVWPGTRMLNAVSGWGPELVKYVDEEIWSTGLWDGIFYDEFSGTVSWVNGGNIDLHNDGIKDDPQIADVAWERAMSNVVKNTRTVVGPNGIIVTNGDSLPSFQPFINGRMFENFPTPWEGNGSWSTVMGNFTRLSNRTAAKSAFIINGNTANTGRIDFKNVRYSLTSTLLGNGYFSYDYGDQDHGQLWRYDEELVNLGYPIGNAVNIFGQRSAITPGVWRRDFDNGITLTNSTPKTQTINFTEPLEKIRGLDDPIVNDGSLVSSVKISPNDGIVLLKPIKQIISRPFINSSFTKIFNFQGNRVRNGFFNFNKIAAPKASVVIRDIDRDGNLETISGEANAVKIFDVEENKTVDFQPYGAKYNGGIAIAITDLDGDNKDEIITAPKAGPVLIKVFDRQGRSKNNDFKAFDNKTNGATLAVWPNKINPLIILGAGSKSKPLVQVFNKNGQKVSEFSAFNKKFLGGVNVATGDIDADGRPEIVTGAGANLGGPLIRIFDISGKLKYSFFSADPLDKNGVVVGTMDADGDNKDEITIFSPNLLFKVTP